MKRKRPNESKPINLRMLLKPKPKPKPRRALKGKRMWNKKRNINKTFFRRKVRTKQRDGPEQEQNFKRQHRRQKNLFLKEARGGGRKGQIIKIILASIYAIFASSRASQKNRFLWRQKRRGLESSTSTTEVKNWNSNKLWLLEAFLATAHNNELEGWEATQSGSGPISGSQYQPIDSKILQFHCRTRISSSDNPMHHQVIRALKTN